MADTETEAPRLPPLLDGDEGLNLGCGLVPPEPRWIGVDLEPPADVLADARELPPEWSGRFGVVWANHVIEHIPGPDQYRVWSEAWRVLRPGGVFSGIVPGADLDYNMAWRDPTHVFGVTVHSIHYLAGDPRPDNRPGLGWEILQWGVIDGWQYGWLVRKPDPDAPMLPGLILPNGHKSGLILP